MGILKYMIRVLLCFLILPIYGQYNSVDIGDDTEYTYTERNKLLNLGTSKQQGGLLGGDIIYNIGTQRLEPEQVGDNYLIRVTLTGKSGVIGASVGCGIYMYFSDGDSVQVGQLDFEFSTTKYVKVQDEATIYTADTFVTNYGEIHCNFGDTTWISNTEFQIGRTIDADPPIGATSLNELLDVVTTTPAIGDILRYDGTSFVNVDPYVTDVVWAEENGGIASNQINRFSFGNGATGPGSGVIPFGIPLWEDIEIIGMVANSETIGTSLQLGLLIDGVSTGEFMTLTDYSGYHYFTTPIAVSAGQTPGFRSLIENGAFSDVRVGYIYKQRLKFD